MRKVLAYFIKYPVAVNVIILAFVLLGYLGYKNLNSSFFPLTPNKFIRINAFYPGASPYEIEQGIVLKIEENLKGLVGIDRVTSSSSENAGNITIEIEKGRDINNILAEVKNAVDKVPNFPSAMEPPVIGKIENIRETIVLIVTGENADLFALKSTARKIENEIRKIDGISQIEIEGFPNEEIEIATSEKTLRSYAITFSELASAIARNSLLSTGGMVKTRSENLLIRAKNNGYVADDFRNIVVKSLPTGELIRLYQVAEVKDIWNESPNRIYYNGKSGVRIRISNTNNEDLISSADKVKAYVDGFNEVNSDFEITVARDRSIPLVQRTQLLFKNAWQGILLVMVFLSFFLRPRLAIWVAAGLPVAFFGMFMLAGYFNITINVLSLFGMIIVIGILVDDGIVISENIYQHYEKGKSPIKAAIDGTMEVIPPILSAITTTILAFSIFFFLDGNIGDFFSEVATVVALTLALSLVEAIIILPAHIAHSKVLTPAQKKYKFNEWSERFLNKLSTKYYEPTLRFFLTHKLLGFAIPIALFMLTLGAMQGNIIRTTLFPGIASDRVSVRLQMPQGTNERITDSIISMVEQKAYIIGERFDKKQKGDKKVIQNVLKRIGPGTSNASININLLPGEERNFSSREISNALRDEVGAVYGVEQLTFNSGGNFGGKPVSVSLLSNNTKELKAAKDELKKYLNSKAELKDVTDNDPQGLKEVVVILKPEAYVLGYTLAEVMQQVRAGFFGFQVQRFMRGQDEIRVWARFNKEERASLANLNEMKIYRPNGTSASFREIATYKIERGEVAINHLEGFREIRLEADIRDKKVSATEILKEIREIIVPKIQAAHPSVSALYEGQNREAGKIIGSLPLVGGVVLLLIYIVIAFTFRSYDQPLMLLIMVPLGLIGVGWGHYIHGFSVNILSLLGIIALIGIMVNDGLVLISKFNQFLKSGMEYNEALVAAGKSRFRAIFLTSITTIAGLAPLIFETSRQAQFLIPMAISIAYGIAVATLLTILTLPLLLSISNSVKVHVKWLWEGKKPSKEEVERAIIELKSEQSHEE